MTEPAAPAPTAPPPAEPAQPQKPATATEVTALRASLEREFLARKDAEAKLSEQRPSTEVGDQLVRAEFRAAAAGKLDHADDLAAVLDTGKFVTTDGRPDREAIAAAVDNIAAAQPAPKVLAPQADHYGVRQPVESRDWMRTALHLPILKGHTTMTAPSIPGGTTGSFSGYLVPADVDKIINLLADGAPFANSLTRRPTSRMSVAFPTARPSGFGWVTELEQIPQITLNDDADIVAVCKLAGLYDLSNEAVHDTTVNLTAEVGQLLSDGMSPDLDQGLLNGSGTDGEPAGIVAAAPEVAAEDLLAGVAQAVGEIGDAGGAATTLAMSATAMAKANTATSTTGELLYPNGFAAALSLTQVSVPGLTTPLVYDASRIYLIINGALSEVAFSQDFRFDYDATTVRVKARVAVGCPAPDKAIRKLTITPPAALSVTASRTGGTTAKKP